MDSVDDEVPQSSNMVAISAPSVAIAGPARITVSSTNESSSSTPIHPALTSTIRGKRVHFEKGFTVFPKKSRPSIRFEVKDPVLSFCGRRDFMKELHECLQASQGIPTVLSQLKVLTGLGGVGKTETARKYIQNYSQFYDNNVVWIDAESDNTMRDSFFNLAEQELGISIKKKNGRQKKLADILPKMYEQLCQQRLLLVFDNAEGAAENSHGLRDFLPPSAASIKIKPFILVTSRDQDWSDLDRNIRLLHLDVFIDTESVKFILTALDLPETETNVNDALALGKLLGHLPLALQQAVAYIREDICTGNGTHAQDRKSPMQLYITEYELQVVKSTFLTHAPFDSHTVMTVYTTWRLTLEKILGMAHGSTAIDLIKVLALLSPENIPTSLVSHLFAKVMTPDECGQGFYLLERYAMITSYEGPTSGSGTGSRRLSIHRQVQRVIIESLRLENELSRLISVLIQSSDPLLQTMRMKPAEESYKHVLANMVNLMTHINPSESQEERQSKRVFKGNVAMCLSEVGNSNMALSLNKQLVDEYKAELGPEHSDTLIALSNQGGFYQNQGDFEESLRVHREVYSVRERLHGRRHLRSMQSISDIGSVLDELGQHQEAISHLKEAYDFQVNELGPDDHSTLGTQHNLMIALQKSADRNHESGAGVYAEAIRIGKEVCEQRQRVLGLEHEDTLASLNVLAVLHYDLDELDQAMELYNQVYDTQLNILGRDHPQTLRTLCNRSAILLNQERFEEAKPVFEKLVREFSATLGLEHPNTLDNQLNLAITLQHLQLYAESRILYTSVFDKFRRILGPSHSKTSFTQNRVALLSFRLGDLETAEENWRQVYEWRLSNWGPKHSETWRVLEQLASICLTKKERAAEGVELMRRIYAAQKEVLGTEHKDSLRTLGNIASGLTTVGHAEEALVHLGHILEVKQRTLGPVDKSSFNTVMRMVNLLNQVGRSDEIINMLCLLFDPMVAKWGIEDEDTLRVYHILSSLLKLGGHLDDLETFYRKVIELQGKIEPKGHDLNFLSTKHNLAMLKKQKGEVVAALKLMEEVMEIRSIVLQPQKEGDLSLPHPGMLYSMRDRARILKKMGRINEALELMKKVEEMAVKVFGEEEEFTLSTRHYLVSILRVAEAEQAFELAPKALEQEILILGVNNQTTVSSQFNLARLEERRGNFEEAGKLFDIVYNSRKEELGEGHVKTQRAKNYLKTYQMQRVE